MSDAYTEVTDTTFREQVEQSSLPVIVDFWAPWCRPCVLMAPTFEAVAREYAGKVAFAKMNTDENLQTPGRFFIQGIPTLIMFKDGKEVDRIVGMVGRDVLKTKLDRAFGVTAQS
jgi:thioredoxin 1